jgi:hypothetical protein
MSYDPLCRAYEDASRVTKSLISLHYTKFFAFYVTRE